MITGCESTFFGILGSIGPVGMQQRNSLSHWFTRTVISIVNPYLRLLAEGFMQRYPIFKAEISTSRNCVPRFCINSLGGRPKLKALSAHAAIVMHGMMTPRMQGHLKKSPDSKLCQYQINNRCGTFWKESIPFHICQYGENRGGSKA